MLRLLVDESTGRAVATSFRAAGCDVVDVTGELIFRSGKSHAGILLFRLKDESALNRVRMARITLERCGRKLAGCFTVVTEKTIRIRPMK